MASRERRGSRRRKRLDCSAKNNPGACWRRRRNAEQPVCGWISFADFGIWIGAAHYLREYRGLSSRSKHGRAASSRNPRGARRRSWTAYPADADRGVVAGASRRRRRTLCGLRRRSCDGCPRLSRRPIYSHRNRSIAFRDGVCLRCIPSYGTRLRFLSIVDYVAGASRGNSSGSGPLRGTTDPIFHGSRSSFSRPRCPLRFWLLRGC